MSLRVSLPPTGGSIDQIALKECIARGSYELYKNIKKGDIPIFGYPHICYSPKEDDPRSNIRINNRVS